MQEILHVARRKLVRGDVLGYKEARRDLAGPKRLLLAFQYYNKCFN